MLKIIWGIPSPTGESTQKGASLSTMNDIQIIHDDIKEKFSIEIEPCLFFDTDYSEADYIEQLFCKLTKWISTQDIDIYKEIGIHEIFTLGYNINTEFSSLEELYLTFKCLVYGFCKIK